MRIRRRKAKYWGHRAGAGSALRRAAPPPPEAGWGGSGTHQPEQAADFIDGAQAAQEAHEHGDRPHTDEDVGAHLEGAGGRLWGGGEERHSGQGRGALGPAGAETPSPLHRFPPLAPRHHRSAGNLLLPLPVLAVPRLGFCSSALPRTEWTVAFASPQEREGQGGRGCAWALQSLLLDKQAQ